MYVYIWIEFFLSFVRTVTVTVIFPFESNKISFGSYEGLEPCHDSFFLIHLHVLLNHIHMLLSLPYFINFILFCLRKDVFM